MKILFLLLIVAGAGLLPFVVLRRPWALVVWRRFKLVFVVYALVILSVAIYRLVVYGDDIYG